MATPTGLTEGERRTRSTYSLTLVALLLLVLVGSTLPLPGRLVIVLPLVLAAVLSVRELRRLGRTGARWLTRLGPLVASGLCVLMLLVTLLQALIIGPQRSYEQCISSAQTETAKSLCRQQRDQNLLGTLTDL